VVAEEGIPDDVPPDLIPTLDFWCWLLKVPGCGPPAEIIPNEGVVPPVVVELDTDSAPPATAAKLPLPEDLLPFSLVIGVPTLVDVAKPDVKAGIFAVLFADFLSLLLSLTLSLLPVLLPPGEGETMDEDIKDGADVNEPGNFVVIVFAPEKLVLEAIKFANPPLEAVLL
jgi:hypothetical protein